MNNELTYFFQQRVQSEITIGATYTETGGYLKVTVLNPEDALFRYETFAEYDYVDDPKSAWKEGTHVSTRFDMQIWGERNISEKELFCRHLRGELSL